MTIESDLLDRVSALLGRRDLTQVEFSNWLGGTITGGPNGDGKYPLTDSTGYLRLVSCPAASVAALSGESVALLATAVDADLHAGQTRVLGVGQTGGDPLQLPTALFASRTTRDLQPFQELIGNELLMAVSQSGAAQSAELREVQRLFTGVINPCLPPYNCRADGAICNKISVEVGSNVVGSYTAVFRPSDVGKVIRISNIGGGGYGLASTIVSYQDAYHVTMAHSAVTGKPDAQAYWGTDNTVGLQAALDDAGAVDGSRFGGVVQLPPGIFLTGGLIYRSASALIGAGRKQSILVYLHSAGATDGDGARPALLVNDPTPQFLNGDSTRPVGIQFTFLMNIGLFGSKYQQVPGGAYCDVLRWNGNVSHEGDPAPFISHVDINMSSRRGYFCQGRHSGTVLALDIANSSLFGWQNSSFDVNAMNILSIANGWAGYASGEPNFNLGSANCNVMNMKLSYNGAGGYNQQTCCNMLELGAGNNYSNMRLQECVGSSLVFANTADGAGGAQWNKYGDLGIDDTGCIAYPGIAGHGGGDRDTHGLDYRAMIAFIGNTVLDNHVWIAAGGPAVHAGHNFASHGVYASGDCAANSVQLVTRSGPSWFNPDHTSDAFAPAAYLNQSSGGTGSNRFTIDGVLQS